VPVLSQVVRVVEECLQLHARPLGWVEDRDPALRRVDRMREEYIDRRVVELVVMGGMVCRRVAQKLLETTPADCDVDAEDAVPVEVGLGVPARVVMDDQSGEWQSLSLCGIPFGS
jgi:hypothetical protein